MLMYSFVRIFHSKKFFHWLWLLNRRDVAKLRWLEGLSESVLNTEGSVVSGQRLSFEVRQTLF